MSGRIYRAVIVGCGRKAATLDDEKRCRINYSIPPDTHAGAYLQIPSVRLVAAADPNEPKRRLMQERYGVPAVYADYREMLTREHPDLVSVTTRTSLHASVTIAAAEAGVRGVICEKAMATSLGEADVMIDTCRQVGTSLIINHTRRWHPTYEQTSGLLRGGAVGELRCIVGTCPGPLIHNGTHLFDLMRMLGGEVTSVAGQLVRPTGRDDPGRAMLHFASGAVGFVDLDSCLGLSLEIQGTCGRMVIDPAVEGVTVWEYRSAPPSSDRAWYQGSPCMERTARHPERASAEGSARSTMIAAIEELISCLETGLAPRSKGEDGRAALEIALAVHASHARGGERVALPLDDRRLAIESR